MADESSYQIMPYKEILELKKRLFELQEQKGTSSKELIDSIAALTKTMNDMMQLFSSAAEEMRLEEKEEHDLGERLGPLIDKVNSLEQQNKTIAEGLVAIADMVKDMKEEKAKGQKEKLPARESFESLLDEESEPPHLEPPGPVLVNPPRAAPRSPMPPLPRMPPPRYPGAIPPGMYPRAPPSMPPIPPIEDSLDIPLPPLEEEPGKKGLFGLFKRK